MKIGIIGLPNVGKSTLFNSLTKMSVLEANYPFATIEPNVGLVNVRDERLIFLANMFQSKKIIFSTVEFVDIAGLIQGAYKGEGLGNQFLNNIRNVDAICHVVKCFQDSNIYHVDKIINPLKDIDIINTELVLSDLEQIENRILKIKKKTIATKDKQLLLEFDLLHKIKHSLEKYNSLKHLTLSPLELKIIKNFNLLTNKPMLYIANIQEDYLFKLHKNDFLQEVLKYSQNESKKIVTICVSLEKEISLLEEKEQKELLKTYNLKESGLKTLINESYNLLGLKTYFTAGPEEVRAWSFLKGMTAPECANIIHSDFQKGFIKAEIVSFDDLLSCKTFKESKNKGKVRLEGKQYIVQDGDIINFRFHV